jgi:predicted amino acid dehydrogenase
VTTGDSLTIAMAVRAIKDAAQIMDVPLPTAKVAIIGATGAIGSVCADMLAPDVSQMLLIGRRQEKLNQVAASVKNRGCQNVILSSDMSQLHEAHLIITVTSAVESIIEAKHLREGAIICDVARPRDISRQVAEQRPDILVIEGGMVQVPGPVDFGFDFGFPPKMAYACMAETMALALEQKYESYTLGKDIKLSQVLTIDKIASRHGFKLGGFRSFERAITDQEIAEIKAHNQSNLAQKITPFRSKSQPAVS